VKYADITVRVDPSRKVYWVDLEAHSDAPRYTPEGLDLSDASFRKGMTVLEAIEDALWDEWRDRSNSTVGGAHEVAIVRVVYYEKPDGPKRVVEEFDMDEHGLTSEYTSFGRGFSKAPAVYPARSRR